MKSNIIALGAALFAFIVLARAASADPGPRVPAAAAAATLRSAGRSPVSEGPSRVKLFLPPPRAWSNPWRWQYRLRPSADPDEPQAAAAIREGD